MGVREALNTQKSLGLGISVLCLLVAASIIVYTYKPQHRPKGDKAFFTDNDGQSYYEDSIYLVPPCDRDGKTTVRAMVYSYDGGRHQFCPYLQRFTKDAKKRLDDAVADAATQGKPPSSVSLFNDKGILTYGLEIKLPGPGHPWVPRLGTQGAAVMTEGFGNHASDPTLDLVIAE
jgi:hypothetical protein